MGGVNLNNIWVYLGGFLSVVAIGLFAVWSILSNIISGIFIFEKKINEKTYPKTEENKGYYLFETPNSQEYLEFISEFDYTEYEIVNVSGNYSTVGAEKELYMVTYKKIT